MTVAAAYLQSCSPAVAHHCSHPPTKNSKDTHTKITYLAYNANDSTKTSTKKKKNSPCRHISFTAALTTAAPATAPASMLLRIAHHQYSSPSRHRHAGFPRFPSLFGASRNRPRSYMYAPSVSAVQSWPAMGRICSGPRPSHYTQTYTHHSRSRHAAWSLHVTAPAAAATATWPDGVIHSLPS